MDLFPSSRAWDELVVQPYLVLNFPFFLTLATEVSSGVHVLCLRKQTSKPSGVCRAAGTLHAGEEIGVSEFDLCTNPKSGVALIVHVREGLWQCHVASFCNIVTLGTGYGSGSMLLTRLSPNPLTGREGRPLGRWARCGRHPPCASVGPTRVGVRGGRSSSRGNVGPASDAFRLHPGWITRENRGRRLDVQQILRAFFWMGLRALME